MFDKDKFNAILQGKAVSQKPKRDFSGKNPPRKKSLNSPPKISHTISNKVENDASEPKDSPVDVSLVSFQREVIHEDKPKKISNAPTKKTKETGVLWAELDRLKKENEILRRNGQTYRKELDYQHEKKTADVLVLQKDNERLQALVAKEKALLSETFQQELGDLKVENQSLAAQNADLRSKLQQTTEINRALQTEDHGDSWSLLSDLFHNRGLREEEYKSVLDWLLSSHYLPLSYLGVQNKEALELILQDRCYIRAPNIPLSKETGSLYIEADLERCRFSGGFDIMDLARLLKDELLINGCTKVVIFGAHGEFERILQVMFAHHALRILLAPKIVSLSESVIKEHIENNQMVINWSQSPYDNDQVRTFHASSLGSFLNQLVQYVQEEL